jgi:cytochrome c-type biogenesis protein
MIADVSQDLSQWWAPALAFLAGVVSFASPCVLPLVPGYISFVTGDTAGRERARLAPIISFIGGFTLVFTLLGAFSSTFVQLFKGRPGQIVTGGIVAVLGVLMIAYGLQRGPLALFAERRPLLQKVKPGPAGAVPLGMAFAAGWTPCIGPVLGGILALAANQSAARGAFLLVCYSLGLGVPFLLVGVGVQRLVGALGWVKRRYAAISLVSGVLLIVMGVLVMTGSFTRLFAPLQSRFPALL